MSRARQNRHSLGTARRAAGATLAAVAAFIAFTLVGSSAIAAFAPAIRQPDIRIAFSKNSFWYGPEDLVKMQLILDNRQRDAIKDVDIRLRIHVRNTSRADMDMCFGGKVAKTKVTKVLANGTSLTPGNNEYALEYPLSSASFPDGVYPMTLEVVRSGAVITSAVSQIVVMDTSNSEDIVPLRLALVFDTLEPSHKGTDGKFKSDELAGECESSGKQPGWYSTLVWLTENYPDFKASFSLSPILFDQMGDMTDGYVVKSGNKDTVMGPQSRGALAARSTIDGFKRIVQSGKYDVLRQPYAGPDLTALAALKWTQDAREQYFEGKKSLEKVLASEIGGSASCPPALLADSKVVRELGGELGEKVMLSSDLLQTSSRGKRIARGQTLGQPVEIDGGKGDAKTLALFEDSRLHTLFDRLSASKDPHGVAQCFLSELTNLYLERPDMVRASGVLWPGKWHAPQAVLGEIARAVSGAPWLKTMGLVEAIDAVEPLDTEPLEIPASPVRDDEYYSQLSTARQRESGFAQMVVPDNPLLGLFRNDLWTAESVVWALWDRKVEGISYANEVTRLVDGEIEKVNIPPVGSLTMASGDSKIPLSILNGTSYRITARLRLASNGLSFPKGDNEKVTLEPKENVLEIPVTVKEKGRVRFQARLETRSFILGEIDFTVLTSRFNTFAIAVVGGILALIAGVGGVRMITRGKEGRHKRGNAQPPDEEASDGASEGA